jgi:cytochrome b6-f complex iron-sulfur subunit
MSTELIIPIGIAVVAVLAAVAAFTIAWRRSGGGEWRSNVRRETRLADRSAPVAGPAAEPEPEPEPEPVEETPSPPVGVSVASVQRVVEVSPEEAGVTRRTFFNRALGITFLGGFGGGLSFSFLSFLWPRLSGGFGSDVVAGDVADLLAAAVNDDGSITPVFIPEAKAYIVPAPPKLSEQFEGQGVEAAGLMALYQRCVHLGCRVPWCQTSQGFECPCHGSKYNGIGEYFGGPAPRNLDRFEIEISDQNALVVKTGTIIETPRALEKSVEYPQGVSCIGAAARTGGVV